MDVIIFFFFRNLLDLDPSWTTSIYFFADGSYFLYTVNITIAAITKSSKIKTNYSFFLVFIQ